jgi:hypothetical protein
MLTPLAHGREQIAVAALGWLGVAELVQNRARHAVGAGKRALELAPDDALATWVVAMGMEALDHAQAGFWRSRAAAVAKP